LAVSEKGDTAVLPNGFKVAELSPFGLVTSVKHPSIMRIGTITTIAVQFANDGNIDIPIPTFSLISVDKAPIAFLKKDLNKSIFITNKSRFFKRSSYSTKNIIKGKESTK
jgi:hypothetical protein